MRNRINPQLLLCLLWATAAVAQICPGTGPDVPCNVTVNGVAMVPDVTVPVPAWTASQTPYNTAHVCWTTSRPSDSEVEVGYNGAGPQYVVADLTFGKVTSHCVDVPSNEPGKEYQITVASCQSPDGIGWYGLECARYNPTLSVAPTVYQQHTGFQYQIAMPPPGSPQWTALIASATPKTITAGKALNIDVFALLQGGSMPNYLVATAITMDGQPCPAAPAGAVCGSTGFKVVIAPSNGEVISPATENYSTAVGSSGAFRGDFFISAPSVFGFTQPGILLRIVSLAGNARSATAVHNVKVTFQAANSSGQFYGNPVVVKWGFTVVPPPTFTATTPSSYPPITGASSYLAAIPFGVGKLIYDQQQNQQYGKYNNDNYSPILTVYDPWSTFNYEGSNVANNFAKWADMIKGLAKYAFKATSMYSIGDLATDGRFVYVVTRAGVSGSTVSFNQQVGSTTTSGTVIFSNVGDKTWWRAQMQRILIPYLNWADAGAQGNWMEWNLFARMLSVDAEVEGNKLAENCDGQGCEGLQLKALQHLASPLVTGGTGATIVWSYKFPPLATLRGLPYAIELLDSIWVTSGQRVTTDNGVVDEGERRIELLKQVLREYMNCVPIVSATNPLPCLSAPPSYDIGLGLKAAVHHEVVRQAMGEGIDPELAVVIGQMLDWFYKYQFNETGSDYTSPYELWMYPAGPNMGTSYLYNRGLDDMLAPFYAWWGAMNGGTACTLPQSGVGCWAAADAVFQYGVSEGFMGTKGFNEAFEDWYDFIGWRSGTLSPDCDGEAPCDNPTEGVIPNQMEPYPAAEWPQPPSATVAGGMVNVTWYNYAHCQSPYVEFWQGSGTATKASCSGSNTFVDGSDTLWLNKCSFIAPPAGTYTFGVGCTDDQGNQSYSDQSWGPSFTFTVAGAPAGKSTARGVTSGGAKTSASSL